MNLIMCHHQHTHGLGVYEAEDGEHSGQGETTAAKHQHQKPPPPHAPHQHHHHPPPPHHHHPPSSYLSYLIIMNM